MRAMVAGACVACRAHAAAVSIGIATQGRLETDNGCGWGSSAMHLHLSSPGRLILVRARDAPYCVQ